MTITVKFFAGLRETVGRDDGHIEPTDIQTVEDVWHSACPDLPLPGNTLMAVNMEYVNPDNPVKDGDEVAFFPPVTGG